MDIVMDANILFAALIRDNVSRNLLVSEELVLYAPDFILKEMEKYKEELVQKTEKSATDFEAVLALLKKRMTLVPLKDIIPFLQKAEIRQIRPGLVSSKFSLSLQWFAAGAFCLTS